MKTQKDNSEVHIQKTLNTSLRVGFVFILFLMSFLFLKPFITPLIWGIIIAVAVFPLHRKLTRILNNREKLSAILLALVGILIIIIPSVLFTSSTIESLVDLTTQLNNGSIKIPSANKSVQEWPLIGDSIYNTWNLAHENLNALFTKFKPQLKSLAPEVAEVAVSVAGTFIVFMVSIIISSALLINEKASTKTAKAVFKTLAGPDGEEFSNLASSTIRTVVQGVLGTALIQAFALSLGLYLIDFPAVGIMALVILIFAIAQLPLILVTLPIVIYVFSYETTAVAVIFSIWTILWSISDNILKPILMGKGTEIPILVILLGAIGGMLFAGIVGLFIGSVFLAFSYKVFLAIIKVNEN